MAKLKQLKVTLMDIEPQIWRRVVVPENLTLLELHAVLQGAMGWEDTHLNSFEIGDRRYETPEDDLYGPEDGGLDQRKFSLKSALKGANEFIYNYDFGDGWRHHIEVERLSRNTPTRMYWGACTGGERACPLEDCGGPYQYPELLEGLADPKPAPITSSSHYTTLCMFLANAFHG